MTGLCTDVAQYLASLLQAVMWTLTRFGFILGIRRLSGHSIPRNVGQERFQCRTSFPYHGATDQGANGYNDGEQQAYSASWARPGRAIWECRRLLLSESRANV